MECVQASRDDFSSSKAQGRGAGVSFAANSTRKFRIDFVLSVFGRIMAPLKDRVICQAKLLWYVVLVMAVAQPG